MTKKLNTQFGEDRHYEKVRGEEFDEKIHWQMYIVKYKLLFFKQYTHTPFPLKYRCYNRYAGKRKYNFCCRIFN